MQLCIIENGIRKSNKAKPDLPVTIAKATDDRITRKGKALMERAIGTKPSLASETITMLPQRSLGTCKKMFDNPTRND
jgi:hypothetical protein